MTVQPHQERVALLDVAANRSRMRRASPKIRGTAMKWIVCTVAIALTLSGPAALAQTTTTPNAATAPSSQTGIPGQPGNKSGPAAKPGDTVGASGGVNPTVQQQDTSKIKGLPGSKSGPAVKKPEQK
jgi:hypothetical protein